MKDKRTAIYHIGKNPLFWDRPFETLAKRLKTLLSLSDKKETTSPDRGVKNT